MAFAATPDVDAWGPDDEAGRPYSAPRPWCLPCRREGAQVSAQYLGIATHIEQIVVVRMDLRTGDIQNTVEQRWQEDWDENVAPYQAEVSPSTLGGTDG